MISIILVETFYAISAAIAVFSVFELIWPRIVFAYFNLNWLLILWFINVILIMFIKKRDINNE